MRIVRSVVACVSVYPSAEQGRRERLQHLYHSIRGSLSMQVLVLSLESPGIVAQCSLYSSEAELLTSVVDCRDEGRASFQSVSLVLSALH